MDNIKKYVIIGNGIAGLSAAETLRKLDQDASITMVGSEDYLTYYRVKLSHFISKQFEDSSLLVHRLDWYDKNRIYLKLRTLVESIDTDKKILKLSTNEDLKYDKLLIATGSRSFMPPVEGSKKEGVFALRTLHDLKVFQEYLKKCETVTVIGGGLLGLEAAWAINELGKQINVLEFFPYLLPRQLDEDISKVFTKKLEDRGLNIYTNVATELILGEENVVGVKLKGGEELQTDAVLFSAGIRPILDVVQDTAIDKDKGIKVNQYMQTNIENIYAAGDVAEFGGNILGLWGVSADQGKVAAENMTGGNKVYEPSQLNTILNIGGISVFSVGTPQNFTYSLESIDETKDAHYKFYVTEDIITGGVIINDLSKAPKFKNTVNSRYKFDKDLYKDKTHKEIIDDIINSSRSKS